MTDKLVERLRECEHSGEARMFEAEDNPEIFKTAADEIERLREALDRITGFTEPGAFQAAREIARAALTERMKGK